MLFDINEDNFEEIYDENNNPKENYIKEQPDILANSTSTNYTIGQNSLNIVDEINNFNSRNSEIEFNNNNYSNNQPEKKINKNKESINKSFNNNIIEEKKNIENKNDSDINIINLVIDKNKNIFNNSIIISQNNSFINDIANSSIYFKLSQNKKICYLAPDTKSAQEIYERYKNNINIKTILLQKGKNKKNKNDLQSFSEQLKQNNLFIILPNILYKLLSIGFVKFSDFGLVIFEDCHLCDANNTYNLIMQEFYFYYFKFPSNKINPNTLPNVLGITPTPFKDKPNIKNEQKGLEILKNISENLNCQIVVDPSIFDVDNNLKEENYDIIPVKSIFQQKNKIDVINLLLMKYFFQPMVDFCLEDYLKLNGDKKELNQFNLKDIKKKYLSVIKEKFSTEIFEEYNNIETSERTLHFLSQNSIMFKAFEDMQKMLINIIQNGDMDEFYYFFDKCKELYQNNLKNTNDLYQKKLYKKLIYLFAINKKVFENLKNKKMEYKTERLNKFMIKLNEIFTYNKNPKTLIIVNNRKMVNILYNVLNRNSPENINYRNKVQFLVGSNNKKEDNSNLTLSTRITMNEINERKKEYCENKINILICTIPALEYLTKEKCEHILVFSDMTQIKNDFEKIKEKVKNSKANLHIFSLESKINNINMILGNANSSDKNNKNEFAQLQKYFLDKNKKIKNPNNYINKNYIEEKHLEKNFYYYIANTEAKMSLKNCMLLFNEINNLYISKNIKINVKKNIQEINKESKFVCQCEFQWGNKSAKCTSNVYNDKQSAENECFLRYIIFLHKNKLIDDHFRILM